MAPPPGKSGDLMKHARHGRRQDTDLSVSDGCPRKHAGGMQNSWFASSIQAEVEGCPRVVAVNNWGRIECDERALRRVNSRVIMRFSRKITGNVAGVQIPHPPPLQARKQAEVSGPVDENPVLVDEMPPHPA